MRLEPHVAGAALPRFDQIAKAGKAALEAEFHRANRAVALFADDHFRLAMHVLHDALPLRHFFQLMIAGLFAFFVIFVTVNKHHHIGVLLDGARFAQV